jgi:hypothetical protein
VLPEKPNSPAHEQSSDEDITDDQGSDVEMSDDADSIERWLGASEEYEAVDNYLMH